MISLEDLLAAATSLDAHVEGDVFARNFEAIAYDSRTLRPGDLFVAVRTERADGHDFIQHASDRGAAGILCERFPENSTHSATCIVVRDTREALTLWARFVLTRYAPEVIAVSGGVGKTSTEEALVRLLGAGGAQETIFSNGNMNDLFGLPVALGGLGAAHSIAVLELASDRAGEMEELVSIARPRGAIITNIAAVHSDSFGTIERIAGEQLSIIRAVPASGWLAVNGDDRRLRELAAFSAAPCVLYGFTPECDVRASSVQAGPEGLVLTIEFHGRKAQIETRLLGFHNAYTLMGAAAAALTHGIDLFDIATSLAGFEPLPGRLRPLPGIDGTVLLDDSQSASPRSLAAALETLALFPTRRIVVLGEVPDLDSTEDDADDAIPAQLAASADLLVTLGETAERLAEAAAQWGLPQDHVVAVNAPDDVTAALVTRMRPGDTVLVKGSESARMERVVERLLEDRDRASSLLVRQDPGWRQRIFLPRERPTWIELDLGAIASNIEHARSLAGPSSELMIVLKADAYGHGAVLAARTALLHGATMGAVACLGEAIVLREAGIREPILILGYVPLWQARDILRHHLSVTVFSVELAKHLSAVAQAAGDRLVPVHVKVDTGMSRLGVAPEDLPSFVEELRRLPGILIEGIYTHLATADEGGTSAYAEAQLGRFREALAGIQASGLPIRYIHAANSAALINGLGDDFNLVRVGIMAYGLDPSPQTRCPAGFKAALSFKTRVAQVRALPIGACVSYGCAFVTERPSVIAVLPVGYGDGFRRSPQNWGEVIIRGQRAPVVGNVCMDMAMIDVTDVVGVKEGDEVVLIGRQGAEEITADDVARRLGTINYEVVTQILPRVPRTVP